jgi:formamidopyrimidine-DNA glycosylase
MPELPEAEYYRRYLESTALHQPISKVEVKDARILDHLSGFSLASSLMGRSFAAARRHGKYVGAVVDGGGVVTFHFGMTGRLSYFREGEKDPVHDRLLITFENGYHLAFVNQRLFGRVGVFGSMEALRAAKLLGPDALSLSLEDFLAIMHGRRGMVKNTLMNQKILAGIGNIYADEILFQAGIHPQTPVSALGADARVRLFRAIREVLRAAVEARTSHHPLPDTYLLNARQEEGVCPKDNSRLEKITISGRTTYFCPNHQRLP